MVDALHEAHRVLRPGGLLIDARPDGSRLPRLLAAGRVRGHLVQDSCADEYDTSADRAVARAVRRRLFRLIETGRVWHQATFAGLAKLEDYLHGSSRYSRCPADTRGRLIPHRDRPITMRRAIKFSVLRRLP
jgi:hypothetical protein